MQRKWTLGLIAMVLCLSLVMAACGTKSDSGKESAAAAEGSSPAAAADSSKPASDKKFKIGVTHYGLKNEFTVLIKDAQIAKAKELGVDIEVFDGDYNAATQTSQFENMIAQKFDAIIFSPTDVDAMAGAVENAVAAGIPVFGVNTKVNSDKLTSYIGSNDVEAGKIEMKWMAEKLGGKGNIVILEGPIGNSAQVQRREGIHEILKEYPDIKVLAEKTANWSRAEGLALMENWLNAFPQIDGVVGQNDEMALGAIQALEEKGLKDKTPVVGVDAIKDALTAVKEGRQDATVFQDAVGQGQLSVEVAVKYLKGEKVEAENMIPFVLVEPKDVDKYLK